MIAASEESPPPPSPETANEVDGVNTDGRPKYVWRSKYEPQAIAHIRLDALYITLMLFIAFTAIFLVWRGFAFEMLAQGCESCRRTVFNRYAYFYLGGLLGGILFGVKYLYKVVARGHWHLDRRLWRLLSPFLSAGLALIVGALVDSGVLGLTTKASSGAAYLSMGFITGYFADRAIDKMQEVAETVFGSPGRKDATPKT